MPSYLDVHLVMDNYGLPQNALDRSPARQLEDAVLRYLAVSNADPKPSVWSKSADAILASFERFYVRIRKAAAGAS